ncbi:DUF4062 domain-containing protein [Cognatishimia activa]|uniref:DUF4062 domain-containing protein n=1 Tax=Cognatishimia activa TaxID=1715691 RepID=UPI00222EA3DA|nr:DUF4062 domain-containing protein [Cognatishimia activa]UZD92407.1 DUF4062 domain-containing protein [Cognatishimia activa]
MPFSATVYNVLIASPSDVPNERKAIAQALQDWNSLNAKDEGKVLLPVMWETHSAPAMGERPQGLINNQVVRGCDLLVGAFWTRFGSPTGVEESGTVEEIKWFLNNKKPTMLYFSKAQVDLDEVDIDQYQKLKDFKKSIRDKGIQENYHGCDELRQKLLRHLTIVMREMNTGPSLDKQAVQAVKASSRAEEHHSTSNSQPTGENSSANATKNNITLVEYSAKAFIIRGNVIQFKDELKKQGGKWITCRDKSKAWMFSKRHTKSVAKILNIKPILVAIEEA